LQLANQAERQDISQKIRQNCQGRIRQVESRDIDTFGSLVELYRVRRSDWRALEDACQNVGDGLADDDCQKTLRETSELFVAKSKVECEDR
jgi:hypothetical protein